MPEWLALLGMVVLGGVGLWTVSHPDGGYRAAGGVGSGLAPATRRWCGVALIAFAVVVGALALVAD